MKKCLIAILLILLVVGLVPLQVFAVDSDGDKVDLFSGADWKQGKFYEQLDTSVKSRRYTVIPCEEGQTFSFSLPSRRWKVFIYTADAQGSINGDNFRVSDGMEYTVRAIGDRVPTSLRVTVAPDPDDNITDSMWRNFDAKCYLAMPKAESIAEQNDLFRKAEWRGTADRYAYFPCELNDTFTFEFGSDTYSLSIEYYDDDGAISGASPVVLTESGTLKVAKQGERTPTYLRITARLTAGGSITDKMWQGFDIACSQASNHIKVASMNYGLWNNGATKYVDDDKVDTVLAAWKKMLDDNDLDILGGQEWLYYFNKSNTITAEKALFDYKYAYQYSVESGYGKNIVSKTKCTEFRAYNFPNGTGRQYTKAYTVINGKTVCLINTHCSLEKEFAINRKGEFEELIRIMNQEEYVIVFGDFNAFSTDEFQLFENAGYSVANGGEFGEFNTNPNFDKVSSGWPNKAIDNVIVSANIQILNVWVDRRDLSDHSLIGAELLLDEKEEQEGGDTGNGGDTEGGDTNNGDSTEGGGNTEGGDTNNGGDTEGGGNTEGGDTNNGGDTEGGGNTEGGDTNNGGDTEGGGNTEGGGTNNGGNTDGGGTDNTVPQDGSDTASPILPLLLIAGAVILAIGTLGVAFLLRKKNK